MVTQQHLYEMVSELLERDAPHLADSVTGILSGHLLHDPSVSAVVVHLAQPPKGSGGLSTIEGVDVHRRPGG